jgi:hypothetical protein
VVSAHHEHEFEAAPGLPEPLPKGEQMLWQGRPDWVALAIEVFHVRKLAIYFALMLVVQAVYLLGEPGASLLRPLLISGLLAVLALAVLTGTAWYAARTTLYTLTDRRVLMRVGMVLTLTFNLPLRQIGGASLRSLPHGRGDLALSLKGTDRIASFHLWPHVRFWQLRKPEPSLRCLPDASRVAALVTRTWQQANPQEPLRAVGQPAVSAPPRERAPSADAVGAAMGS